MQRVLRLLIPLSLGGHRGDTANNSQTVAVSLHPDSTGRRDITKQPWHFDQQVYYLRYPVCKVVLTRCEFLYIVSCSLYLFCKIKIQLWNWINAIKESHDKWCYQNTRSLITAGSTYLHQGMLRTIFWIGFWGENNILELAKFENCGRKD